MHHLLEQLANDSTRRLIWGLVPRGIGFTFLIAFASLWRQIVPLIGKHGIDPAGLQLARLRQDLPWISRLRLHPSVLWLAHSDFALRFYVASGILAAGGMMLGGAIAWPCNLYCWGLWLSFHFPLRFNYPWDTVLHEASFLCLFLPRTALPPALAATQLPHPLIPLIFQLLIARVLFGFGKTKFFGIRSEDWNYTKYFLMNMPLCSRIGWHYSKMPDAVHKLTLAGIGFVELVCPLLVLLPGLPRLIGGAGIIGQMAGIQLTGNFGYFNLLTTMLCISTVDITPSFISVLAHPGALFIARNLPFTLVAIFIVLATPLYLIFNSWFTYGLLCWPAFERLRPGPLKALLALMRLAEPLHIVNSYGVFRASPAPPVRWVTVVEGSHDGETWQKYRYQYTQTDERSRPRFVAPHHPRLDHASFYDAVGVDGVGYLYPVSLSNPYLLTPLSLLDRTMQRLLEPGAPAAGLFANVPFPEASPPQARVALYRFTSTTPQELKETGRYWDSRFIGLHIPPAKLNQQVWNYWMPPPELYHPEAPLWRRRARSCRGIDQQQLSDFWDDFLPYIKREALAVSPQEAFHWEVLPVVQRGVRKRYQREQVREFQLTLGRLTMILMARLDAVFSRPAQHFLRDVAGFRKLEKAEFDPFTASPGDDAERVWQALAAWPHGALRSRFHVWLLAQWTILEGGREAWQRMAGSEAAVAGTGARIATRVRLSRIGRRSMADAAEELGLQLPLVLNFARSLTIARGMFLEGVVNYDMVARQANRLRVLYSSEDGYTPPPTGLLPGVLELIGDLRDQPALCMMYGWGDETQVAPLVDPPRMVFGKDREWREVSVPQAASSGSS